MPTHEEAPQFWRDWEKLTNDQKDDFKRASRRLREDLVTGKFRSSLLVKGFRGLQGVFEMSYAADGRALWMYGAQSRGSDVHIVWLRVGTHDIFRQP